MQRASTGLASEIRGLLARRGASIEEAVIVVLVGPGNNGGDALSAAAALAADGGDVTVLPIADAVHSDALASARRHGVHVSALGEDQDRGARISRADVVVDGMFGIGSPGRGLRGEARAVVESLLNIPIAARPLVVAVDVPSGIDADSGVVPDPVVLPADLTVTFGALKTGLVTAPARELAGEIRVVDIGLGEQLFRVTAALPVDADSLGSRSGAAEAGAVTSREPTTGALMTTASTEQRKEIGKLVTAARIGLLTTVDADGRLLSRPLATVDVEFDGDVWFFVSDDSHKAAQIARNNQVNVAFESGKGYLSIAGRAEIVHDRAKIDEYWNPAAEAWFEGGKEDPNVSLLKVTADSAEYWSNTDPKPVVLLKYAAAVVTGKRPDTGDNESVEL